MVWRCNKKYEVKGKKSCENNHIDDKILYQGFINTFNAMIENKHYFMDKCKKGLKSENVLVRYKAKQFIKIIEKVDSIKEFDMDLYYKVIERIIVYHGNKVIVKLIDATEVEVVIE